MRFEKAINIYSKDGILKRFKANETKFSAIEGNISAIISEKEILELQNGHTTMYTKLGEVTQTAGSLKSKFESFSTDYDERMRDYDAYVKTTSEHIQTAEQFQSTVTKYMNANDEEVEDVKTVATQTADKFTWLVKSGTSETDFTLTDRTAELLTQSLVIKNKNGSKTIISGGAMNIEEIFAQDVKASGTITGATLKGADVTAETITANKSYSIYNGSKNNKIIYYDGSVKIGLLNGADSFDGAGFEFLGDKSINVYGHMYTMGYDIDVANLNASGNIHSDLNISAQGNITADGYVQCNGLINTYSEYQSQKGSRDWRFGSATGFSDQNWFGFYDHTNGLHGGWYGPDHTFRSYGEVQAGINSANAFRAVYSNIGFIIRNDGGNVYFMGTNINDPYGAWNDNYTVFNPTNGQWTMKKAAEDGMTTDRGFPVLSDTGARVYSLSYTSTYMKVRIGTSTTYHCSFSNSDIRLKENVSDTEITDALGVINAMPIRQFDWKDEKRHQKIGFIADEIEKLDPSLTQGGGADENGNIDIKSIDTLYLLGYVVKAVQELSDKVAKLEKDNEKLKKILNLKEE